MEKRKQELTMKKIEMEDKKIKMEEAREQRNSEISEMIRKGITYNEIATKYGISEKTVYRIANQL